MEFKFWIFIILIFIIIININKINNKKENFMQKIYDEYIDVIIDDDYFKYVYETKKHKLLSNKENKIYLNSKTDIKNVFLYDLSLLTSLINILSFLKVKN